MDRSQRGKRPHDEHDLTPDEPRHEKRQRLSQTSHRRVGSLKNFAALQREKIASAKKQSTIAAISAYDPQARLIKKPRSPVKVPPQPTGTSQEQRSLMTIDYEPGEASVTPGSRPSHSSFHRRANMPQQSYRRLQEGDRPEHTQDGPMFDDYMFEKPMFEAHMFEDQHLPDITPSQGQDSPFIVDPQSGEASAAPGSRSSQNSLKRRADSPPPSHRRLQAPDRHKKTKHTYGSSLFEDFDSRHGDTDQGSASASLGADSLQPPRRRPKEADRRKRTKHTHGSSMFQENHFANGTPTQGSASNSMSNQQLHVPLSQSYQNYPRQQASKITNVTASGVAANDSINVQEPGPLSSVSNTIPSPSEQGYDAEERILEHEDLLRHGGVIPAENLLGISDVGEGYAASLGPQYTTSPGPEDIASSSTRYIASSSAEYTASSSAAIVGGDLLPQGYHHGTMPQPSQGPSMTHVVQQTAPLPTVGGAHFQGPPTTSLPATMATTFQALGSAPAVPASFVNAGGVSPWTTAEINALEDDTHAINNPGMLKTMRLGSIKHLEGYPPWTKRIPDGTLVEDIYGRFPNHLWGMRLDLMHQWRHTAIFAFSQYMHAHLKQALINSGTVKAVRREDAGWLGNRLRTRAEALGAAAVQQLLTAPKLYPSRSGMRKGLMNTPFVPGEGLPYVAAPAAVSANTNPLATNSGENGGLKMTFPLKFQKDLQVVPDVENDRGSFRKLPFWESPQQFTTVSSKIGEKMGLFVNLAEALVAADSNIDKEDFAAQADETLRLIGWPEKSRQEYLEDFASNPDNEIDQHRNKAIERLMKRSAFTWFKALVKSENLKPGIVNPGIIQRMRDATVSSVLEMVESTHEDLRRRWVLLSRSESQAVEQGQEAEGASHAPGRKRGREDDDDCEGAVSKKKSRAEDQISPSANDAYWFGQPKVVTDSSHGNQSAQATNPNHSEEVNFVWDPELVGPHQSLEKTAPNSVASSSPMVTIPDWEFYDVPREDLLGEAGPSVEAFPIDASEMRKSDLPPARSTARPHSPLSAEVHEDFPDGSGFAAYDVGAYTPRPMSPISAAVHEAFPYVPGVAAYNVGHYTPEMENFGLESQQNTQVENASFMASNEALARFSPLDLSNGVPIENGYAAGAAGFGLPDISMAAAPSQRLGGYTSDDDDDYSWLE